MQFPHECVRCGYCCLASPCMIISHLVTEVITDSAGCPMLKFDGDIARCGLAGFVVPIGDGCCVKARVIKDGKVYDFASLPREYKCFAAQRLLKGGDQ